MRLQTYIQGYSDTLFPLVAGSVWRPTITEQLDSFTATITNTSTRLHLEPFQFFHIVDTDDEEFDKFFVLDSYTENIENLNNTRFYTYSISLMSPLKYFEKIILPNRTVIHSKVGEKKKIREILVEMLELYLPRVKVKKDENSWEYNALFTYDGLKNSMSSIYRKFDIDCPDLSWNSPSLREVITTLMQIQGCLPTIINGYELSFLDLRKDTIDFIAPDDKKFFVSTSNSSDSFVNCLTTPIQSALDVGTQTRNEVLGFRDVNNVLLKQSDLKLTTDLPIKSVNSLVGNIPFGVVYIFLGEDRGDLFETIEYIHGAPIQNQTCGVQLKNNAWWDNTQKIVVEFYKVEDAKAKLFDNHSGEYSNATVIIGERTVVERREYNAWTSSIIDRQEKDFDFISIEVIRTNGGSDFIDTFFNLPAYYSGYKGIALYSNRKINLTPLVYERNKRKLLDIDYAKLNNPVSKSVDFLKDFYYTTLEYTYGGNTIEGFGNTRSWFTWYGTDKGFLIEAIYDGLTEDLNDEDGNIVTTIDDEARGVINKYHLKNIDSLNSDNCRFIQRNEYSIGSDSVIIKENVLKTVSNLIGYEVVPYALFWFSIEYEPFIDAKVSFYKTEEINYPFVQLDTQEASIPMYDEFSLKEQDKINRLGNNTLKIIQPNVDLSEVNDILGTTNNKFVEYEGSILWQQEIAFYKDFVVANYTGSKNYIMKNYFTALQNKYRAYEYIDMGASVQRKENINVFVRIGHDYLYAGSDQVCSKDFRFFLDIANSGSYLLTYNIEGSSYTKNDETTINTLSYFKKDVCIYANNYALCISSNNLDNQTYGTFIENLVNTQEQQDIDNIGGFIQSFYIHKDYDESHLVGYTNQPLAIEVVSAGFNEMADAIEKSAQIPLVELEGETKLDKFVFALRNQLTPNTNSRNFDTVINSMPCYKRVYHKSLEEKINETVQFTYYSADSDIKFSKWLIEYNALKRTLPEGYQIVCELSNSGDLREDEQYANPNAEYLSVVPLNIGGSCSTGMGFEIQGESAWQKIFAKIILYSATEEKKYDLMSFNWFDNGTKIYFSVNDTKTDKVYEFNETSQLYELTKKVQLHTVVRRVEDL